MKFEYNYMYLPFFSMTCCHLSGSPWTPVNVPLSLRVNIASWSSDLTDQTLHNERP